MKPLKFLAVQISDLLVYLLIPVLSLLMPVGASRRLICRVSRWDWLMAGELDASLAQAQRYAEVRDEREWRRRSRMVSMLEARDLSLMMWGRGRAVYEEIEGTDEIARARDRVLIGMHWGPSIAILGLLHSKGQNPLLVYRSVEREILRARPWYYLFLKRSVRYIGKMCGERAVTIRGAGARLAEELPRPGTSVVVLDAPPAPGRSTINGTVLGQPVRFNAGFPDILTASGRKYLFYAISLKPGNDGSRILELEKENTPGDTLMGEYCRYLGAHLSEDSAQWRIWQVAGQFFQQTGPEPGASEQTALESGQQGNQGL